MGTALVRPQPLTGRLQTTKRERRSSRTILTASPGTITRHFATVEFFLIEQIEPDRDESNQIIEITHELAPAIRQNKYAAGPFCRFHLSKASTQPGVYIITIYDELKYIGECENFAARFSSSGYGGIAPRNCHHDGQSTNCKLNARILADAKAGRTINLWFVPTPDHKQVEAELIAALNPPWNGRKESLSRRPAISSPKPFLPPTVRKVIQRKGQATEAFRQALELNFEQATARGETILQVRAGDLHRQVGGYPGRNHRMPVCCRAMRLAMVASDRTVEAPPKGDGASLAIEYRLPRC